MLENKQGAQFIVVLLIILPQFVMYTKLALQQGTKHLLMSPERMGIRRAESPPCQIVFQKLKCTKKLWIRISEFRHFALTVKFIYIIVCYHCYGNEDETYVLKSICIVSLYLTAQLIVPNLFLMVPCKISLWDISHT